MREQRWRLAEPHVERKTSAKTSGVEEAEPRYRVGLIAPKLADKPLRSRIRYIDMSSTFDEVAGPAAPTQRDTATERRALDTKSTGAASRRRSSSSDRLVRRLLGLPQPDRACSSAIHLPRDLTIGRASSERR